MRHLAVLLAGLVSVFSFSAMAGNDRFGGAGPVRFYGIDFSNTVIVGAAETPEEFHKAFKDINLLFLNESAKYIGKLSERLGREVSPVSIETVMESIDSMDVEDIECGYTTPEEWTSGDVSLAFKSLGLEKAKGEGLVVIASVLDKGAQKATFFFVFFDNETMEIIDTLKVVSKPNGIGLRNYWAGAYYRGLSEINPTVLRQKAKGVRAKIDAQIDTLKVKL